MRSAIRTASSYLKGGPLKWLIPLHLHIYKKSDYDDDYMTGEPKGLIKIISGEAGNRTYNPCGLQGI